MSRERAEKKEAAAIDREAAAGALGMGDGRATL